jgi:hypothetical protein
MTRNSFIRAVRSRRTVLLACLLALGLVALVLLAVYVLPSRLIARDLGHPPSDMLKPPELLKATDDIRKTLLQGIGGLLFLATAFFTYQQLKVSRDNHTTEQFTKAIDHLGSERMDVRVGGIYALERIARASRDGRERGPVLEILSTYVREHSPIKRPTEPDSMAARIRQLWKPSIPGDANPDPATIRHLDADIHAALLVLARRSRSKEDPDLILSGTDLRRAYLAAPKIAVAQLSRVNLQESVLQIANLQGADLTRADLWRVDLRWSNLKGAKLRQAHLHQAKLCEAELNAADLRDADLRDADLRRADLSGANLTGAKLEGVKLRGAKAEGTQWPTGFDAHTALMAGT